MKTGVRTARRLAAAAAIAAMALAPAARTDTPAQRELTFSGRCPIDIIFPLRVDAQRARELKLIPRRYDTLEGPDGKVLMAVSLLYCNRTRVAGVAAGRAFYHDLLFQIQPPFGSAAIPPDHQLDGYWPWFVTTNRRVHRGLSRVGMFHGFERGINLTGVWAETPLGRRLRSVSGRMPWPRAPFKITGAVFDTSVPEGSDMRFWQDVNGGVLRSRLTREFGAEEGSAAYYTLTTPVDSPIAKVLEEQCAVVAAHPRRCTVSGPGFVTHIVGEFVHDIEVRRAANWKAR